MCAFVWTRSNRGSFVGSKFNSKLLYILQLVVIRIFPNHWKLYDKPSKWLIVVSIPSRIHWMLVLNVNSCKLYPTIWCVIYVFKKCGWDVVIHFVFFQIIMNVDWRPTILKQFLELILEFRITHEMHYKFPK